MLASITRYFSAPISTRAYSVLSMPMRLRVQRAPTRAIDHNVGRGTSAFNEREAALENKHVRDHEAATLSKIRAEAKKEKETPVKPRAPRNSGLKAAAAAGRSAEIEAIQQQINALQAQIDKMSK